MKQIFKREPLFYTNFISKKSPMVWADIAEISFFIRIYILSGIVPLEHLEPNQLSSEQNFQCAYTEVDIDETNYSSHIDHFRKQSLFPGYKFAWTNLFISTNNEYYGAKFKDNSYKIRVSDYQYLINPAIENPREYFDYSFSGEILIKSKDIDSLNYIKAKITIEVFNLNENSLVQQRQTVVKQILAYYKQLSVDEIKNIIGRFDSLIENIYHKLIAMNIS